MTESMLSPQPVHRKKIDIRERSVTMGSVTGVNGYRVNRGLLKQRFTEGGYRMDETPHFLLFRRSTAPAIVIVHWLAPEEIDANVGDSFLQAREATIELALQRLCERVYTHLGIDWWQARPVLSPGA